jgi:hypothetical protein
MENRKMIESIYLVFICMAAFALIVLNIYQHQKIIRLSQGNNQQTSINTESTVSQISADKITPQGAALSGKGNKITGSDDDLKYQLEAAVKYGTYFKISIDI